MTRPEAMALQARICLVVAIACVAMVAGSFALAVYEFVCSR